MRSPVKHGSSAAPVRIAVIGNYSGRNVGDAAILGGLLHDITCTYPERPLRFEVPTIAPGFIRRAYAEYPVHPVGLLPWHLSVKILGLPILRCVLRADLVLVTDAVLFDYRLYNPLFNYLHTLSWVLPLAAGRGVPVVLYNVSLGPVRTEAGRRSLGRVLRASRKLIVREPLSASLARELGPAALRPLQGADAALSIRPAPPEALRRLGPRLGPFASDRPILAFNVNRYLDAFMSGNGKDRDAQGFQRAVASVLERAIRELGVQVMMVQTHPADAAMTRGVLSEMRDRAFVAAVDNSFAGYPEMAALLGRADALIGMRTHSLILAALMGTPVAGIIAYPKTCGFLQSIGCPELALEFSDLDEESLWGLVRTVWGRRSSLASALRPAIRREREKAAGAAHELSDWLGPPAPHLGEGSLREAC